MNTRSPSRRKSARRVSSARRSSSTVKRSARSLQLNINAAKGKSFIDFLRDNVIAAHAELGDETSLRELSLALVGDAVMSALHQRFMNIAGPTDVLTFPLEEDARGMAISGEIIIDLDEARRRAKDHHVRLREELLLYAIHGLLHLSGYDDRTKRGYGAMHRMEDHLLTRIGLEPVFARPAAGSRA